MARHFVLWLPFALVVGGLIGAWGPSEELRSLRNRPVAESETAGKARGFDAFAKMVNIPDVARRRRPDRSLPKSTATNVVSVADGSAGKRASAGASAAKPEQRAANPEDLRVRIEQAAELWRTRCELVRANAVDALGLDEKGEAGFDAAVEWMNGEIRASVQAIADALAEEEELTPELGTRLIGELSVTMAETYDLIGEAAGDGRRGDVSRLQLVELVDPSVAEPLIAVQDKLERSSLTRERRR